MKKTFLTCTFLILLALVCALSTISFLLYRENRYLKAVPEIVSFVERIEDEELLINQFTSISPDGKYTAYLGVNDLGMKNSYVWVVENETQKEFLLAENKTYQYFSKPIWSADSKQIAFYQVYPFKIWTIQPNGANRKLVYSQDQKKEKNLFNPTIGFAGDSHFIWNDKNQIEFENNKEIPMKIYGVDAETRKVYPLGLSATPPILGEEFKSLVMTHYSQRDPKFENKKLGTCQETIGSAGCAVAAIAMALDYYGHKVTPEELNSMLSKNSLGYFNGCDLRWNMIPNLFSDIILKGAYFGEYNLKRLDHELSLGHPVIVGFDRVSFNDFQHWVVVIGKKEVLNSETGEMEIKYLVEDPWSIEPVERDLDYFGKRFNHMVVYEKRL